MFSDDKVFVLIFKPKVDIIQPPKYGQTKVLMSTFSRVFFHVQEITFMMMDGASKGNGHGVLHAFEYILSTVFIPSLRKLHKGWGDLEGPSGAHTREDFLNKLDSFVSALVSEYILRCLMNYRPVYAYRLGARVRHSHRQSLSLSQ